VKEQGTTAISGITGLADDELPPHPRDSVGLVAMARAIVRLVRAGSRIEHLPTLGQVRAMARCDGVEPCSYLLDRTVNFVPEPMEFGYERELGRHALCFSCRDPYGRAMELVAMSDGGAFDLLGGF
jgi:hypothetical protein